MPAIEVPPDETVIVGYRLSEPGTTGRRYCINCASYRHREPITRGYPERLPDTVAGLNCAPIWFVRGPLAHFRCADCETRVYTAGPEIPRRWHTTWGHAPFQECRTCHQERTMDRAYWYRVAGRWSRNCRSCCDARRAEEVLSGRRPQRRSVRPLTGPRRFGVELEFMGTSRDNVALQMEHVGLAVRNEGYTHAVLPEWKLVTDSSLPGYDSGELVSPPLRGEDGYEQLTQACQALRTAGAEPTLQCGLHVHHEVADLDGYSFGRLFRFYYQNQRAIDRLIGQARRSSVNPGFCSGLSNDTVRQIERLGTSSRTNLRRMTRDFNRYNVLNVTSYPRYGTIEFRQHHPTYNAQEILAWVELGQAMLTWANADAAHLPENSGIATVTRTLLQYGLDPATSDYLLEKAIELTSPGAASNSLPDREDAWDDENEDEEYEEEYQDDDREGDGERLNIRPGQTAALGCNCALCTEIRRRDAETAAAAMAAVVQVTPPAPSVTYQAYPNPITIQFT